MTSSDSDDGRVAAEDDTAQVEREGMTRTAGRIERPKSRGLLPFRNVALISILVVGGAVGYELWRNPELTGGSSVRGTPNVDATPAGDQLRTSERYQDNLRRQNEQGAEEAEQTGDSFIATPDEPLRDIDAPPVEAAPNPNRPLPPANASPEPDVPRTVVVERPQLQEPPRQSTQTSDPGPDYSRINQLAQAMAAQQQGLAQSWQVQPSGVTVVIDQELYRGEEEQGLSASGNGNLSTRANSAPTGDVIVRAGDVVLASTIITNDSDTPGPVVAEIRRGPLQGTRLVGGFQANQNNTHLIVQFNSAVLPDGTQVPITAYAVDASQRSLAVRTDLDRRLFARYAPRVAAAFVSGLGDALSDRGTTIVDLGAGVGISRPEATFEQGVYQGIAEVGNDLAGEFVRSAPSGPLISLRSRQIIGVLFTQNVERP